MKAKKFLLVALLTGSNVKIQNNGRIIPRTNRDFYIPIGTKMQINYGRIK